MVVKWFAHVWNIGEKNSLLLVNIRNIIYDIWLNFFKCSIDVFEISFYVHNGCRWLDILSIKNRCTKHGNKYKFYCSIHGDPCCVMCTRDDHRHCQELRLILEVTENVKSSTAQEILTFRTPGGRQFRFVVMITDVAALCCCCCHVNVSEFSCIKIR
jgi:hypothetical protein